MKAAPDVSSLQDRHTEAVESGSTPCVSGAQESSAERSLDLVAGELQRYR
jgi:hypothetical protein